MSKKVLILLFAFVLLLSGCESAENSVPPAESSDTAVSAPEASKEEETSKEPIVIMPPEASDTPVDGEQMEGEFGKYTFISEENGKTVAGIYKKEQIKEFSERKEKGEWYTITYDEMCYLVEDTFKLFEEYDLVRITDINGEVHTYYGLSFYSSDEYYACFNRLASSHDPACSFDLDQDIRDVIFKRLEVLTTSICYEFKSAMGNGIGGDPKMFYFGMEDEMSEAEMSSMSTDIWVVYNDKRHRDLSAYNYGVLVFCYTDLYAVPDVSEGSTDYLQNFDPGEKFPYNAGKYEYGNENKTIIVEVQETENFYPVARIRIDNETHIEELERLWGELHSASGKTPDDIFQNSDYRIIVYFNGFADYFGDMSQNCPEHRSVFYRSDGKFDTFSLAHDTNIEQDVYCMGGCEELAASINRIVEEILNIKE